MSMSNVTINPLITEQLQGELSPSQIECVYYARVGSDLIIQSDVDPVLSVIVVESVFEFVDNIRPQVAVICSGLSVVDETVDLIKMVSRGVDGLNYSNLENDESTAQILIGTLSTLDYKLLNGDLDHSSLKLVVFCDFSNMAEDDSFGACKRIINACPTVKQIVSFCCGDNEVIKGKAESLMTDPRSVVLQKSDHIYEALQRLRVYHVLCSTSAELQTKKLRSLLKILMKTSFYRALVFTEDSETSIELARICRANNMPAINLPNDEEDFQTPNRIYFAENATDVSHLIDISTVSIVVNFNIPTSLEQFTNNIICASTNGTLGLALTIGTKSQIALMRKHCEELNLSVSPVPPRMNETFLEYSATHQFNYRIPPVPNPLLPEYHPPPVNDSYLLNTLPPYIALDMDSIMEFLFEKGGDENRWCIEDRIRLEKFGLDFSFLDNNLTIDETKNRIDYFKKALNLPGGVRDIGRLMETESWTHPKSASITKRIHLWQKSVFGATNPEFEAENST